MTKHDQYSSGRLARFVAASMFVSMACISGYWITERVNAFSAPALSGDVTFWAEITGSDKDGFDLFAKNTGEASKSCKATVKVTMNDDSTKSYDYSRTVSKTDKMSFGGEAGLKPAPIKQIEITSSGCEQ